jgi:hypothetical protein
MIKLKEKSGAVDLAHKMMKGDDGGYYIPTIDAEGNITWVPTKPDMEPADSANILGPTGPAGSPGVYVGTEEPTDPNILVWLCPTGDVSDYVMTETEVKDYIDTSLVEVEYGTY